MSYMTLANARIPNTPAIRSAMILAQKVCSESIYNHVMRSLVLGFVVAAKMPDLQSRDQEAHAIAAILHDLGLPLGDHSECETVSKDKRFEVDGANAARAFLLKEWPTDWNQRRVQLVWDAIALHAVGSIALHKEDVVKACCLGIRADFLGPDALPRDVLTWVEYETCVQAFPRSSLASDFKANMLDLCIRKPCTTYDNTVGEWGSKYLDSERYDRSTNSVQALIERSITELDRRDS